MNAIEFFNPNKFIVSSEMFTKGEYRLNSDFYEALITSNNFHQTKTFPLKEIAFISHPGITKRNYIDNPKFGLPFLSTSDMQFYEAVDNKYVSKELSKNLKNYIVEEFTILISRSGTIGSVAIVDKYINGCAVTEHAIRVALNDRNQFGFVYTFLTSDIGQKIIKGQKSGAVIDEIYDADIENLEIPVVGKKLMTQLNENILIVKQNRELAFELINKARILVYKFNNLPELLEEKHDTLIRRTNLNEFNDNFRLDAHFYNPIAETVVKNVQLFSSRYENLYVVADCSFKGSRSIRNYVDKEKHGVPFLSGKNIIQVRPDFKYISTSETSNLSDMIVEKNQILISRSGTLGRTVFVWNNYENFAASEHLIRVVPNSELVDEGYLYAFLSSDYGYHQLLRYKHGSVIDEITEDQISQSVIPLPSDKQQKQIGDLVRQAYDLRAEAIRLEDEAQALLTQALTKE